ncbi:GNAT family N-acetyltransferase [Deferribacteres bacterium DY0037]
MHSDYQINYLNLQHKTAPKAPYSYKNGNSETSGVDLEWDTDILGIKSARITMCSCSDNGAGLPESLGKVVMQMEDSGVQFIDFRCDLSSHIILQTAQKLGFYTTDVMNIYLSKKAPEKALLPDGISISSLQQKDADTVEKMAAGMFTYSRIYKDPNISKATADNFYKTLFAHFMGKADIRVIHIDGTPAGFTIGMSEQLENGQRLGYLWLIGVSPDFAGHGLGSMLLNDFLVNMHKNCDMVEIGTQVTNTAANRIYAKAGLPAVSSLMTLHRWTGIQ